VSVGTRGTRYSINSDGRSTRSVGIPGTGLYYRSQTGPRRSSRNSSASGAGVGLLVAIVIVIAFFIVYWRYAVPVTAALIFVGVVAISTSKARQRGQHERTAGTPPPPPPPSPRPARLTHEWIVANVPRLDPAQLADLLVELHTQGWSDAEIDQRVRPYLPGGMSH
jgi:hypothetical protein